LLNNVVDMSKNLIFRKQVHPVQGTDICQHTFVQSCITYVQVLRRAKLQYKLHDGLNGLSFYVTSEA
jgi:hypothetical protein